MAVPKYNEFYNAFLQSIGDGAAHHIRDIRPIVASLWNLSDADLNEKLPSGLKNTFHDRLNWTATYLKKAGLITSPARANYQLTEEGKKVLQSGVNPITDAFLMQYPSFQQFKTPSSGENDAIVPTPVIHDEETPQATIDAAFSAINAALADDIMAEIMARDSDFFEALVVKLLRKMGYGGSMADAGIVTKHSNDGGIDGIIKEDKLGFDRIYIQAKRWDTETSISRPEIQKFSGALQDEGASKGLFITTAKFSSGARESANKQHIVLVDGEMLTKLMIEYGLGVSTVQTYEIKTLDSDFFHED